MQRLHEVRFIRSRRNARLAAALPLIAALLAGCALPPRDNRTQSVALTPADAQSTPLAKSVADRLARHPGQSGIDPLADARAAFAARMDLAGAAQRTLDVQYYIWRNDLTGTLLLEALHEAADRGVRVRLLLDDNGIPSSLDSTLAALDAHPDIEVRLFNPFVVRRPKMLGFITDFSRANRRMHNKSFTADSTATIVGGRNIGDEYFDATDGVVFADLDVLAVGPIASDTAHDFDRYWASASAYPADRIIAPAAPGDLDVLARRAQAIRTDPAAVAYIDAIRNTPDVRLLLDGTLPFEWAHTQMVSDDPAKGLGLAPKESKILPQLQAVVGRPSRELDLVSPYFVPAEDGTAYFTGLAKSGVTVRVLTNSLEATDVAPVHSGYARRRPDLLRAGVELYEMKRQLGAPGKRDEKIGSFGSSGSSLHAKTFAVDGERVFVGSLNFDPRSANLNTELGFVIDSPTLAKRIEEAFWKVAPQLAYEVKLDDNGRLYWIGRSGDQTIRYDTEPNTTWTMRVGVWFFSILPIEWLL
ncbi:phospholipase D family protein [Paraburkholderia caballeronis]|uniref:Putative cardiolipin synthase n=1 Tax=Paraburkholderia caballeronis TaxID=416943 RepID=A0A1H7LH01_9BURK|nr:phospholipase D family protein [Paraburkholderia caballeronis]PXW28458.1 putative cardiolipin synthase [Paraburkholderia caballeronis]PXX03824.1 putative cardiolipin synthase [Paraburkholderia caballeronis]RAK04568.1 putative cardiolipin synthase [Paraburkholderia caballeronis]SED74695.1 putative cardiolipin synthase [Paraburkholderia caballeronis]SEK98166.1 putative cardiolipin synthase [Paraburkholderia caballeronis]